MSRLVLEESLGDLGAGAERFGTEDQGHQEKARILELWKPGKWEVYEPKFKPHRS